MLLRGIDQAQGRQGAYRLQHPQQLGSLTQLARVQSTEASNRIEGITAPAARIKALVEEKTTPENRSEQEIAGYRSVLDLIHSTPPGAIPFTPSVVKQLHGDLYAFAARSTRHGHFKVVDNTVEEELPDGTTRIRFHPVAAWKTEDAMRQLHEGYEAAVAGEHYHPLILTAAYVLDFLVIHPFSDGNGRMSRLLTLLLLYKHSYEVGRFVSLEQLVDDTKETYYEALAASTSGWHDGAHDLAPWTTYFLGVLTGAYGQFEQRVGAMGGRGSKQRAVRRFVRSSISDEFTIGDVHRACPDASVAHIRKVLGDMRHEGLISEPTRGRNAKYRRLTVDFDD